MMRKVRSHFLPNRILVYARPGGLLSRQNELLGCLATNENERKPCVAHICRNFTCSLPVSTIEDLETLL